ncbi:hypothetical protein ACH5RR_005499 [Cinchona calisaya]|uniref:Uncharacterized protein n=1 Tax=Cinchona calisaya TaxID=153742 RepID=A0ABD3ALM0_9GENT
MGRAPCCDKANVKRGPWSPEEDAKLKEYIDKFGTGGNWIALPQKAGLRRCGKSCRLRWLNYLRPNIKHGDFTDNEDRIICSLFASIGSRWSIIAAQLPGRTDNDIKNYWNTKLKKKLIMGMAPSSQKNSLQSSPFPSISVLEPSSITSSPSLSSTTSSNFYTSSTPSIRSLSAPYETFSSIPSSLLISTTCSSNLQEGGYIGSVQTYHQDSFLRFGSEAPSCSSSDGSSTNQNYLYNGVDENQNIIFNNDHANIRCADYDQKPYGDQNPLDYSLEEIKQLFSTNLCNNSFV